MITQFPTPTMSMRKRDKIIQEACAIAAEDDAVITEIAQTLADRIPGLGAPSALRLLAAIGLAVKDE